eukprot:CAMPEP_0171075756 /NCGR_PEP_ID=MMETSP0766_2-20121228/12980_1 /TAXON_ID=439317 /ORGANISM="Gambierdiscus australes, Strain CAWD 149" /LENGTH=70 /DNA_ID=CAMNT_0011532655 /DNA_START=29 /DNA_END=239 /DNA_ORIENTATION=-
MPAHTRSCMGAGTPTGGGIFEVPCGALQPPGGRGQPGATFAAPLMGDTNSWWPKAMCLAPDNPAVAWMGG